MSNLGVLEVKIEDEKGERVVKLKNMSPDSLNLIRGERDGDVIILEAYEEEDRYFDIEIGSIKEIKSWTPRKIFAPCL